jgi:hypothetical protein
VYDALENTMVPLEIITKSLEKNKTIDGRPEVLLDSPLIVSALRKDLNEEREAVKTLGAELEQKKAAAAEAHRQSQEQLAAARAREDELRSRVAQGMSADEADARLRIRGRRGEAAEHGERFNRF